MPLLHPTGGLIYHARAARMAQGQWTAFREDIGQWLEDWRPEAKGLLLVGPSAGYSLPSKWLERFEEIVAIDFDPLAERLFRSRHRGCRVSRWIGEDIFPVLRSGIDWRPLEARLREYPGHAVLFSNVLGQVAVVSDFEEAIERSLGRFSSVLVGREWASYHDRLSAPICPTIPIGGAHRNDFELAAASYREGGEITSHATGLLGRGMRCDIFQWECRPQFWYLVEACRSDRPLCG